MKIGIITGSTRPGRKSLAIAEWLQAQAQGRDHEYVILDIADANLPLLDEPRPPAMGQYEHEHTKAWSAKVGPCDGFIMVTPEYNHGVPGGLKNAIDFLGNEWSHKAVGFVGYGSVQGVRAVEQLRQIVANFKMADVRTQVGLSIFRDFADDGSVITSDSLEREAAGMFAEVEAWSGALASLRG